MTQDDPLWWQDQATRIKQIENDDHYVTNIHGRLVDGRWQYAIVRWSYGRPSLVALLGNGQVLEGAVYL